MHGAESEDDFKDFFTGAFDTRVFRNDLTYDESGFIGRNLSGSYSEFFYFFYQKPSSALRSLQNIGL